MRKVVVVGGSSGIGAAIADMCHGQGCRVLTMQRGAGSGECVELDLRWDQHAIDAACLCASWQLDGLDWLVLAGGVGAYTNPIVRQHQVEEMMQTNYLGPRLVFNAFLKHLKREAPPSHFSDTERTLLARTSRVLYIGSTITRNPTNALEDYAASKAAGETYFRAAARRYAKWGIRCNVLATGWIDTPMVQHIDGAIKEKILRRVPLHRWGKTVEVADAAYSILAGPDFWNGDVINFSGGL